MQNIQLLCFLKVFKYLETNDISPVLGPRIDPADMTRMDQSANLAIDGTRVAVDDKDGLSGRTD